MKRTFALHCALVAMLVSACGADTEYDEIKITVAETGMSRSSVCLDVNSNLACDADEPQAMLGTDGIAVILVPENSVLDNKLWIAEMDDGGVGAEPLRLLAPAMARRIDGLSSLVASTWLANPSRDFDAAATDTALRLGLTSAEDMLQSSDISARRLRFEALDVLSIDLWTQGATAGANSGSGSQAIRSRLSALGEAVTDVLRRYDVSPEGDVLATVSTRTLRHEVRESIAPTECPVNVPVLVKVDTVGGAAILNKEDFVNATITIGASVEFGPEFSAPTQIRGRGNSTWTMPKKPYRLKLSKKSSLLGMPEERDWALLANYADKSLMRNAIAFCMGQMLGFAYTPRWRAVELELNGAYQGVYQLVEHLETGGQRVDIGNDGENGQGFLIEIDHRRDADLTFISRMGVPFAIKSDATSSQFGEIVSVVDELETTLFPNGFAGAVGVAYRESLDTEAAVDFYLVTTSPRSSARRRPRA
jgi:hypothetical protein